MTAKPIQPTQLRAEQTRQKLLDAAIICLAEYGYADAELGLISDTAGAARRTRLPSRGD